ncbi:Putative nuclear MIS12/MIND complex subunit PMF1/Nnf1 protein [Septoria linicola]|uniref:Nuclear MIS12/MIND complex subunit PMF1/Nnf1 protein n=1 Tax=Septoria linicola TaxID=215465 RepID=A0A9Q9AFT4_9PEZI|nr:putative nuclear MIS12/MIND complex subunit PMF1/Nnf1 protein [Septoria linicola]USW48262.1 Putative nuclear MIS12/MIND complex subunit PMF1/Nnf1 protein [Septoria linicola]
MATDMEVDTNRGRASRSPSPIGPPPTPSAPGPRATALQKLYNDAINHVLKTCSYNNFAACFPTPARQVPGSVKLLHEQFTQKLGESMRKEFESILAERSVVLSLNELDRLIEDARRRKTQAAENGEESVPVPAHTLPARQLYISHLAPTLGEWDRTMRERQEALGQENEEIMERVQQQRQDIKKLIDGLEGVVKDLNGSVAALQPEQIEGLRAEAREADSSIR